jgi:hypothetical protein
VEFEAMRQNFGLGLGAYLAQSLSQFLVSFLSTQGNSLFVDLDLDRRVLAFTTGLTVLTCLYSDWRRRYERLAQRQAQR